jgi:hypothetical protein
MKNILFTGIALATLFTSCASYSSGYQSSTVQSRNVQLDPIVADIVVDESEKLKGESESAYLLFFRLRGDNRYADGINYSSSAFTKEGLFSFLNPFKLFERIATGDAEGKVKSAAAYDALDNTDADVLVHPTYNVYKKNYLIYYVYGAEVQGYAGKYTNFRTENPLQERLNEIIAQNVQFNVAVQGGQPMVPIESAQSPVKSDEQVPVQESKVTPAKPRKGR